MNNNDATPRLRSKSLSYEEFKSKVDDFSVRYFYAQSESERINLRSKIADLYYSKGIGIDYYRRKLLSFELLNNESIVDEFDSLFGITLIQCLDRFNPEKALFRTYFERCIVPLVKKLAINYSYEADKVISDILQVDENSDTELMLTDKRTLSDYYTASNEGTSDNQLATEAEIGWITLVSDVLNFYKNYGNSERDNNKVIQLSTIYTSKMIDVIRNAENSIVIIALGKHERQVLRSFNGELVLFTYVEVVKSLKDVYINHLKTYSDFKTGERPDVPEERLNEEIVTPFEQLILIAFLKKAYGITVSKPRITQLNKEFNNKFIPFN